MRAKLYSFLAVMILQAATVSAFDGNKVGLVLGAGIGVAPYVHWETNEFVLFFTEPPYKENKVGVSFDLKGGMSWNNSNQIVIEANGVWFHSDKFRNRRAYQFFAGPVYYHFFGPPDMKRFSVGVGAGIYSFDLADFDAFDPGFGWMVVGAYNISRNLGLACNFAGGKTSESDKEMRHSHLSVNVNVNVF